MLLFLIFYLFAIAGIMFFRDNDPWHFGNVGLALLTLFRMSTLEDWTDVMYINIYGCLRYNSGLYVDAVDDAARDALKAEHIKHSLMCTDPTPQPALAATYSVVFIIVAALLVERVGRVR